MTKSKPEVSNPFLIMAQAYADAGIKYKISRDVDYRDTGMGRQLIHSPGYTVIIVDMGGNNEEHRYSYMSFDKEGNYIYKTPQRAL